MIFAPQLARSQSQIFVMDWLGTTDPVLLEILWRMADETREQGVGDAVHLRGLVEISNHCRKNCCYCGIRHANHRTNRYRMEIDEILECALQAVDFGYGTLVLQAGEDESMSCSWVVDLIHLIKKETNLTITLSLGEQSEENLSAFRSAGADRYFMRFETSNQQLYQQLHPNSTGKLPYRISLLEKMKSLGYETGSGAMVDLPGQTYRDICTDLQLIGKLEMDMVGLGPFIPHPDTPLGKHPEKFGPRLAADPVQQELLTCKMTALLRILYPDINIPATTASATLNPADGTEKMLRCGANVIMPNLTPNHYRRKYDIYPGKAGADADTTEQHQQILDIIRNAGRTVGTGPGSSRHYQKNRKNPGNTHHEITSRTSQQSPCSRFY